jgi:hypothetical protein
MNKINLNRIGWTLIALSVLLFLVAWQTSLVVKNQSLQVSLDHVLEQASAGELAQIKTAGLDDLIRNCQVDLRVSSPQSLRIGKIGGINLEASSTCKSHSGLPEGTVLKADLQDDYRLVVPRGEITAAFGTGRSGKTFWSIQSINDRSWHGTLWVRIVFAGNIDPPMPILLAAIPLSTQFDAFMGLSESQVIWTSSGITILGLAFVAGGYIKHKRMKPSAKSPGSK